MFKDVKAVAIVMLLIGGVAGFTGAKVISTNTTNNVSQETVQQVMQDNTELKAQIAELNAKLDRAEESRRRFHNDIEAEGRRAMGTRPGVHSRKIKVPKGY